jgi:hypothetical protein
MKALKPSLAMLVVFAGITSEVSAQGVASGSASQGFASYPGAGTPQDYYSINGGFGSYGLPGSYPNYQGHALSGYGPGASLDA